MTDRIIGVRLCICPVCDRNGTVAEFTPTKEAT